MTDKTATQNLTRTQSTDDHRLTAGYLGTLAGEVDQRMTAHYFDLARSVAPPAAVVRRVVSYVHVGGDRVSFDTAEVDSTGSLVDLSVSDELININQSGYWNYGAYVQCSGFGGNPEDTLLNMSVPGDSLQASSHNNLASGVLGVSVSGWTQVTAAAALTGICTARLSFAGSGFVGPPTYTTIYLAVMWAYKVREL